jgi:hypothetical protein
MEFPGDRPLLRIGELSRRLGVSDHVLRVLRDVVLPYLADLGERWQRGTASVAMEHFATNVIRGRLAGLARGWGAGTGRRPCSPARPANCTIWR